MYAQIANGIEVILSILIIYHELHYAGVCEKFRGTHMKSFSKSGQKNTRLFLPWHVFSCS